MVRQISSSHRRFTASAPGWFTSRVAIPITTFAIKPDGAGNVTSSKIVWRTNKGVAYVPSPIIEGDYFLIVSDSGVAHCFEAATGRLEWQERMGEHHASLVSASGLVYFLNDDGAIHVVKPGAQYNLVAKE